MIKKLLIVPICFFQFSCVDPDTIPIAPFTHIPLSALWTTTIDRRIVYGNGFDEAYFDDLFNVRYRIYHGHAAFKNGPGAIVYENYANPFTLQIIIEDITKSVIKVEIEECKILNSDGESKDILEILPENKSILSSWVSNDNEYSAHSGRYSGFSSDNEIIIERNELEYVDSYLLHFDDIPINYSLDETVSLFFNIKVSLDSDKKTLTFEKTYERKIEECIHYPPIKGNKFVGWYEISLEEFEKNL